MPLPIEHLLLGDWNVYMHATQHAHQLRQAGRHVGMRKPLPANLAVLADMVAWCKEQGVEPRLWMFHLFARTNWRFPPKWPGSFRSEAALEKFRRTIGRSNLAFFRRRVSASKVAAEDGQAYDPNRDTTPSVEGLKARYLESGQEDRCMGEMLLRTLGYHPRSDVCGRCRLREECAVRLEGTMPFPVLALRSGRITSDEAERMAHAKP